MNFRRYYQWQTIIAIIARILRTPARITIRTTARIILRIPRTILRILRMILRTAAEDNLLSRERGKLSASGRLSAGPPRKRRVSDNEVSGKTSQPRVWSDFPMIWLTK